MSAFGRTVGRCRPINHKRLRAGILPAEHCTRLACSQCCSGTGLDTVNFSEVVATAAKANACGLCPVIRKNYIIRSTREAWTS
jgi:hypothetical protein